MSTARRDQEVFARGSLEKSSQVELDRCVAGRDTAEHLRSIECVIRTTIPAPDHVLYVVGVGLLLLIQGCILVIEDQHVVVNHSI